MRPQLSKAIHITWNRYKTDVCNKPTKSESHSTTRIMKTDYTHSDFALHYTILAIAVSLTNKSIATKQIINTFCTYRTSKAGVSAVACESIPAFATNAAIHTRMSVTLCRWCMTWGPNAAGVLLCGERGDINRVAVNKQITNAAHKSVFEGTGPQFRRQRVMLFQTNWWLSAHSSQK